MNKRFLYSSLLILTGYAIINGAFHAFEGEYTRLDFLEMIIELALVLTIFIVGEGIVIKEKKELTQKLNEMKQNISFLINFEDYCNDCKNAIVSASNNSSVSTIQTPIFLESDNSANSGHFKDYITETAKQLLIKNSSTNSAKIILYRRLIVINNKNDVREINEEKIKLRVFLDSLYNELHNWTDTWKPTLKNIHIGIIRAEDIFNSPFSNLDVLLVTNTHLVIAFPIENNNNYMWGTSLHLNNKKGYFDKFDLHVQKFEEIYKRVWDNSKIKRVDFGNYHQSGNLDTSKANILKAIEASFSSLTST